MVSFGAKIMGTKKIDAWFFSVDGRIFGRAIAIPEVRFIGGLKPLSAWEDKSGRFFRTRTATYQLVGFGVSDADEDRLRRLMEESEHGSGTDAQPGTDARTEAI